MQNCGPAEPWLARCIFSETATSHDGVIDMNQMANQEPDPVTCRRARVSSGKLDVDRHAPARSLGPQTRSVAPSNKVGSGDIRGRSLKHQMAVVTTRQGLP
jgi:hypothetical protein